MPPQQQPPYGPLKQPEPLHPAPAESAPSRANQYEFIMNPNHPKRPAPKLTQSPKGLLFIVVVAAVVVGIMALVVAGLSGGNKNSQSFIAVAQQQQEIGRVADLQYTSLKDERIKEFTLNTKLTMATDQGKLTTLLGKNGVKVSPKQLALGTNSTTDTKLTQALATSDLDATVSKELQAEIGSYKLTLRQAYGSTTNPSARTLLKQFNTDADLLLAQAKQ